MYNNPLTYRKFKDSEKFRPMFVKSIDPSQPAQSAQADMGRYFSQILQAPFSTSTTCIYCVQKNCHFQDIITKSFKKKKEQTV